MKTPLIIYDNGDGLIFESAKIAQSYLEPIDIPVSALIELLSMKNDSYERVKPTFRTSKCSIKKLQSLSILRSQLGKNIEYFYSKL